ncbi:hypothetical protein C8Q78DRAFT_755540 [Trametes maxima]|nr:hypothetical protein C8Q78DRAFT_755540 [Trametes maxima]
MHQAPSSHLFVLRWPRSHPYMGCGHYRSVHKSPRAASVIHQPRAFSPSTTLINSSTMVPTKSRVCQTTQNIPAPQGPRQRAACHTRFATAPAEPSHKQRKAIPVESFADVLSHPAYYCEMYPDTLPLTRELCQQLRAANVARAGGGEPAVTQVSPPDSVASLSPREELAMDSDDIVEGISRRSLSQAPPPIGKERQTVRINPFQETGHGSAMTHHSVKLGGYDSPTTLDDSFYDEAARRGRRRRRSG